MVILSGVVVHPQVPGARGARRRAALGCDQNSDQALRIIINSTLSSSHQHQHQIIIITLSSALAPTPGHHSISISIVMKMLSSLLSSSSLSTLDHQQEGQMGWYVVQPVGPPPHRSDYTAMGSGFRMAGIVYTILHQPTSSSTSSSSSSSSASSSASLYLVEKEPSEH